jgi:hypothetical protein
MLKQLLNGIRKNRSIGRALENTGQHNPVLSICWKDLILLITVELSYLARCCIKRRPACSSKAYSTIISRLIDKYKVIHEKSEIVNICVAQICITLFSFLFRSFFRPMFIFRSLTDGTFCYLYLKLMPQKDSHLIKI